MPASWYLSLVSLVSSNGLKLSQACIEGACGKFRALAWPPARSIKFIDNKVKHLSKGLDDSPVELVQAIEERHNFEESVLEQSKIIVSSAHI